MRTFVVDAELAEWLVDVVKFTPQSLEYEACVSVLSNSFRGLRNIFLWQITSCVCKEKMFQV